MISLALVPAVEERLPSSMPLAHRPFHSSRAVSNGDANALRVECNPGRTAAQWT